MSWGLLASRTPQQVSSPGDYLRPSLLQCTPQPPKNPASADAAIQEGDVRFCREVHLLLPWSLHVVGTSDSHWGFRDSFSRLRRCHDEKPVYGGLQAKGHPIL